MTVNPIFDSGSRRRMRTARTPLILTAYLALLLIVTVCLLPSFMGGNVRVLSMRMSTEWYIWMTALQFLMMVLVAPAVSAGSIAGERERQTFDLLLVTGVGSRRIVLGKLMENYAFLLLMLLCSAPVMLLAYVTGGVPVTDILLTLVYLAVIAFAALAVGMLASVIFRRTMSAILAAYLILFAIGALSWVGALRGPFAAAYTYTQLAMIGDMSVQELLMMIPPLLYLNPAVTLVMLLSSQTGILHNTMQSLMRLGDIYTLSKQAGFFAVSGVGIVCILIAALLLVLISVALLHAQSGGKKRKIH